MVNDSVYMVPEMADMTINPLNKRVGTIHISTEQIRTVCEVNGAQFLELGRQSHDQTCTAGGTTQPCSVLRQLLRFVTMATTLVEYYHSFHVTHTATYQERSYAEI